MPIRDVKQLYDVDLRYQGVPSKAHPDGRTYIVASPDPATGVWLTAQVDLATRAAIARAAVRYAQDARGGDGAALDDDEMRQLMADLNDAQEQVDALRLDDDGERSLYQRVLGSAYDEMVADGVPWLVIQNLGRDAYLCFAINQEAADEDLARTVGKAERAAAAAQAPQRPATTKTTRPRKAGSSSNRASTGTRARRSKPAAASTRSSTSPNAPEVSSTGPALRIG